MPRRRIRRDFVDQAEFRASVPPIIRPVSASSSVRRSPIARSTARYTRNGQSPGGSRSARKSLPAPPPRCGSSPPVRPAGERRTVHRRDQRLVRRAPKVKSCSWTASISPVSVTCWISAKSIPAQKALPWRPAGWRRPRDRMPQLDRRYQCTAEGGIQRIALIGTIQGEAQEASSRTECKRSVMRAGRRKVYDAEHAVASIIIRCGNRGQCVKRDPESAP